MLKYGEKYDLIHSHSYAYGCSFFSVILSKILHKPIIITLHGLLNTSFYKNKYLKKTANKLFDFFTGKIQFSICNGLISVSKNDLLEVNRRYLCKRLKNNFYIPNGLILKEDFTPPGERKYITFVGGLNFIKGFDIFLEIVEEVNKRHPHIPILIVGNGTGNIKLYDLLKKKKTKLNIKYIEKADPIDSIYFKTKVFIMSSRTEGMPTTVLEAMKFDTPILATNIGANLQLIKDGYNGFLFDYRKIKEAADKVEILLNNLNIVKNFTRNSKLLLIKNHNWYKIVRKIILAYKKITEDRPNF